MNAQKTTPVHGENKEGGAMDSILTSVKKLIGIDEYDEHFDPDIIMLINTTLSTLNQLGVGPTAGFSIVDEISIWDDFTQDVIIAGLIKSYIYLKVKLIFDPPQSSAVIEAMNRSIAELEFRLIVATDPIEI